MVYSNPFHAVFLDEKRSGIDVIHHGVMTITSQSVATHPSPYDGRLLAQNGWFVARALLPAGKTRKVLEW